MRIIRDLFFLFIRKWKQMTFLIASIDWLFLFSFSSSILSTLLDFFPIFFNAFFHFYFSKCFFSRIFYFFFLSSRLEWPHMHFAFDSPFLLISMKFFFSLDGANIFVIRDHWNKKTENANSTRKTTIEMLEMNSTIPTKTSVNCRLNFLCKHIVVHQECCPYTLFHIIHE